jgi:hypothetical protein
MSIRNTRTRMFVGAVGVGVVTLAISGLVAGPASAGTADRAAAHGHMTVPMTFTGYDARRAAEHGFDVRTDAAGDQYAVPTGTPDGSMLGATEKYHPDAKQAGSSIQNTLTSNCGTASFDFDSPSHFTTSYHLNGDFGAALGHTWNVATYSAIDALSYNLDGTPPVPGVSLSWTAERDIATQALHGGLIEGTAGGTVFTVLGDCVSGTPYDAVTNL